MKRKELVSKIMSTTLVTVGIDEKLSDVQKALNKNSIHHVLIIDGKKLIGMVSSTDMLKCSHEAYMKEGELKPESLDKHFSLHKIMQTDLVALQTTDTLQQAIQILSGHNFHSIPILNEHKELVGIVTSTDLVNYLGN